MKALETERLILRPIIESDAEAIFEYSQNKNVGINAGWKPHENIEETREIMPLIFLNQENVFGVVLKETGKLFGTIGIIADPKRQNNKSRMIGYAIGEDYWGKGFTTEAVQAVLNFGFEELELDLISAYCYPDNERSKRVLKKCGFQYEGCLRLAEECYDGSVRDNECYAIVNKMLNHETLFV